MPTPAAVPCALALLALTGALDAQVTTQLETGSAVGLEAGPNSRLVQAGTPQSQLFDLGVTGRDPRSGLGVASLDYVTLDQGHVTVALAMSSAYEPGSNGGSMARTISGGPVEMGSFEHVWRLSGSGVGTLFLDATATAGVFFSGASLCEIDVGDDGQTDLIVQAKTIFGQSQSEQRAVGVELTPGTDLIVRVRSSCRAAGGGSPGNLATASLRWDLRFLPGIRPAEFTNYGPPCGAWLRGSDSVGVDGHHIEVLTLQAYPGQPVGFVFGLRAVDLPLDGSCRLLVEPLGSVIRMADAQGLASLPLGVVPPLRVTVYLQAAAFGPAGAWRVTDGLRIELADQ